MEGVVTAAEAALPPPTAHETSSGDRSRERYRRAALTSVATLGARGSALASLLVSVPLVIHSVGPESFGVWLTLASILALLGFADLGIGNGLVNAASRASADDDASVAAFVASAFYVLAGAAIALGVVFAAAYAFVPWADLVNAHSSSVRAEVAHAVAGLVALFLLGLPLRVVDRTQTALQDGFYANIWLAFGNVAGLGGLALAVQLEAGLSWLVWAAPAGHLLAAAANSIVFFGVTRRDLFPWPGLVRRAATSRLAKLGLSFFVLQVAVAVAYQSDAIVVAHVLGPEAVQEYAVPMRLFLVPSILIAIALTPLWPAYSEAIARHDRDWVMSTFRRTLVAATVAGAAAAAALALAAPRLIELWVGDAAEPSSLLIGALAVWLVVMAVTGPVSVFLNGASVLVPQAVGAVAMMAANLGLSIALAKAVGVSGVVWGTVAAQIVFFLLPAVYYTRRTVSSAAPVAFDHAE